MTPKSDPVPSGAIDPPRYRQPPSPFHRELYKGIFDTDEECDPIIPAPGWVRIAPPREAAMLKFHVALHQRPEA